MGPLLNVGLYGAAAAALYLLNSPQPLGSNVGVKSDSVHLDGSISFDDIAGIDESKAQV